MHQSAVAFGRRHVCLGVRQGGTRNAGARRRAIRVKQRPHDSSRRTGWTWTGLHGGGSGGCARRGRQSRPGPARLVPALLRLSFTLANATSAGGGLWFARRSASLQSASQIAGNFHPWIVGLRYGTSIQTTVAIPCDTVTFCALVTLARNTPCDISVDEEIQSPPSTNVCWRDPPLSEIERRSWIALKSATNSTPPPFKE